MGFIKELEKEMPFGRVLIYGAIIYGGMLGIIDIFLLLARSGVPLERLINTNNQISAIVLSLIIGLFTFAFVMLTIFVPQVIGLYPILGYFFTFVRDNRKIKILPLSNKQKYSALLKNWAKVIGIYVSMGILEALYLLILFGSEINIALNDILGFFTLGINMMGISILGTLIFAFSIVIAAMIQNVYKIDTWKVVVTYIVGYIVLYIIRGVFFRTQGVIASMMVVGVSGLKDYTYVLGAIYLVVFVFELVWTSKNIDRVKVK